MPRTPGVRKDLRQGLRNLHRYWRLGLNSKIRYSNRLIENVLASHSNPVVCWSGGKDSTVVLHLVLKYKPGVKVVFNDSGVEFPETRAFVKQVAKDWKLNLHIAKPSRGETFWDCVRQFGWPIFGKAQASKPALIIKEIRSGLCYGQRKVQMVGGKNSRGFA